MIPSKILRRIISQKRSLNLEPYSWNKKFEQLIFGIQIKDDNKKYSLGTVYSEGYNIGNCLITSCHINKLLCCTTICAGKVEILKGTKNSEEGDHVWVETETSIIDPTLMITIPKTDKLAKLYVTESTLSLYGMNLELSYSGEFYFREKYPDRYYTSLYRICD